MGVCVGVYKMDACRDKLWYIQSKAAVTCSHPRTQQSSALLGSMLHLTDLELEQLKGFVKRIEAIGEVSWSVTAHQT